MPALAMLVFVGDLHISASTGAHEQHSAPTQHGDPQGPRYYIDLPEGPPIVGTVPEPLMAEMMEKWGDPPPIEFDFNLLQPEVPDIPTAVVELEVLRAEDQPWDLLAPDLPPAQSEELPNWGQVWINALVLFFVDPVILLLQYSGPEAQQQLAGARDAIRPFPYSSPEQARIGAWMELGSTLLFSVGWGLARSAISAASVATSGAPNTVWSVGQILRASEAATTEVGALKGTFPAAGIPQHSLPAAFVEKAVRDI